MLFPHTLDQQRFTGTDYTGTFAMLVIAFVFTPATLMVSGSFGLGSMSLSFAAAAFFSGLAWLNWRTYSTLTVSSILSAHGFSGPTEGR